MEKRFVIQRDEYEIPCRLEVPEFGEVNRLIISVHGFCGSKDEAIQTSLGEEMALFSYATMRFDFPAHGENPMTDRELTLENCTRTLLAVAEWTQAEYPDVQKCMFATGFGAFVTVVALEDLTEILGSVRLVLQTPSFRMAETLLSMKNITEETLRKQGRVTVGRVADRKIEVPYSFYEELRGTMVYTDYEMPMLLIVGECDEVLNVEDVEHFRRINEQTKLVSIPGADHQFRTEGAWDMVVDLTRDWFECEQVLLCDYE